MYQIQTTSPTKFKMATFVDPWIAEEVVVSTALHKEHEIKAPGTSDILSVAEFKAECTADRLHLGQLKSKESEAINAALSEEMGIPTDALKQIQEVCKLQTVVLKDPESMNRNSPLKCVQHHRRVVPYLEKKEQSSIAYSNVVEDTLSRSESTADPVPDREVLLGVDIFHPTKQMKVQHLLVLASQKLTELRDKIVCPNDYLCSEDLSGDPSILGEELVQERPSNRSKSALFFISNTFYNDMRHPESVDVSMNVTSWAEERGRIFHSPQLEDFDKSPMEDVTFESLKLRLGYPYLYSHHGNCEHLMIFREMRLFNPQNDSPFIQDYPRLTYYSKVKRQPCRACGTTDESKDARWMTCDDEMAPESPCFFCHNCFIRLHYSVEGQKVCQFKAYRYQLPNIPTF